jgi:hypothetical protein
VRWTDIRQPATLPREPRMDIREVSIDIRERARDIRERETDIRKPLTEIREPPIAIREPAKDIRERLTDIREELTLKRERSDRGMNCFRGVRGAVLWAGKVEPSKPRTPVELRATQDCPDAEVPPHCTDVNALIYRTRTLGASGRE